MKLQGGNNPQNNVHVDADGRIQAFAISEPEDKATNQKGRAWSVYFDVTPTAGEYFFYLKNNGIIEVDLTDIRVVFDGANELTYEVVSGTAVPTGAVTTSVTSRNLGFDLPLSADVEAAASFAGLTGLGVLFVEASASVGERRSLRTSSNIIIPQGKAIAFKAVNSTGMRFVLSVVEGVSI